MEISKISFSENSDSLVKETQWSLTIGKKSFLVSVASAPDCFKLQINTDLICQNQSGNFRVTCDGHKFIVINVNGSLSLKVDACVINSVADEKKSMPQQPAKRPPEFREKVNEAASPMSLFYTPKTDYRVEDWFANPM